LSVDRFDLSAGLLCLDFSNTVDWHASAQPKDRLKDYADLINWGEAAAILTPSRAKFLGQLGLDRPSDSSAAFSRAVRLREAIYRIFSRIAQDGAVKGADLAILNESLTDAMSHLKIAQSSGGFSWDWFGSSDAFDQIGWPVARSAAELLTSNKLERVRHCADDRGCGMLFLDTSRNKSRRWCSMGSCGNRAKAKRHYQRAKSSG
jgi:predicted RNA-binding Zn ribbon-like protein